MSDTERTFIIRRDDAEAVAEIERRLGGPPDPAKVRMLSAGVIPIEGVEFIGLSAPTTHDQVNLHSPIGDPGGDEGWVYTDRAPWAAYSHDLVAVRVQQPLG